MKWPLEEQWEKALSNEINKDYFVELIQFIEDESRTKTIYPPQSLIFEAFNQTPLNEVKVVLIGQDPYHGAGQANGLSFSVNDGMKLPPSLRNIYKELSADLGIESSASGNLIQWAKQGVLLLNATLTVEVKTPGSHQKKGWEQFTDAVISHLSEQHQGLIFILWGAYAKKKGLQIDRNKHRVIESAHPSPFAAHRGFFGSQPFSKTNQYLVELGKNPIDWSVSKQLKLL